MSKELWRPINGLAGRYEVSTLARIRSVAVEGQRQGTGKIRKQTMTLGGYWGVVYRNGGRTTKTMRVHRVLAQAFIPNPQNLPEVNHRDGNKLNNSLENLEWCRHIDNVRHAFASGLVRMGAKRKNSKLNPMVVREIRQKYVPRLYSQARLAKEYGVSQSIIGDVINKRNWKGVL